MHDHTRRSLSAIDDPVTGSDTQFWEADGTQWTISAHFDRWIVHRGRTPVATLHRTDDGWRTIAMHGVELDRGDTVQEVLRPLL